MPLRFTFIVFLFAHKLAYTQYVRSDVAEKIKMNMVYQVGFICIPIGEAWFQSIKTIRNNYPQLKLEAEGYNLKTYDYFYKFSSYHLAYINLATSNLTYFERKVNQNGNTFKEIYSFDNISNNVYSQTSQDSVARSDTLKFEGQVFDFLSAFQYLRFIKYENMKPEQKVPILIILENKTYPLYIKFLGLERVILPDGNNFVCYKIAIKVIEGAVFKGGEALTVWVSADRKKLPVQMEAEIRVGNLKAYLSNNDNVDVSVVSNVPINK